MSRPSQWRDQPTCLNCPAERPPDAWAKGWRGPYCHRCSERWQYHGRPEGGPPPPRPRLRGPRLARLEDYRELRSWGESMGNAAERLGVSFRTAQRYEAQLREMAEQGVAA